MRIRTIILLLLAVVLAGGTAYLARVYLASQRPVAVAPVAPPPAARSVLVAKADIPRGRLLVPNDLAWQVWPEGPIDKNYILMSGPKKLDAFVGWVARNPIASGEPVTETKIVAPGNRGFLAAALRPGMRAITMPVSLTSGIAGFLFPGDDVDLLLTFPVPVSASGQSKFPHKATETMMRHVRVLAIDQRLESKAGQIVPGHSATLEVTPKQSEAIALASEIGRLSLVLTSLAPAPDQTQTAGDQKVTLVADQSAPGTVSGSSPEALPAATATYTVDSDINPLLPKFRSGKDADAETGKVTILRGSAKVTETASLSKTPGANAETPETPEQPEQQKSGE
jgi:pilus assembly protein CpaB